MVKTELGEDTKIRVSLRSHTKVDTGGWFCDRPVWVSLTSDEILLTAAGKRPFFERILIQNCGESHYNAATGELVISPAESLMCKQLAFHPDEAIELLKAIGIEESKWMNHSDLVLTETDEKYDFITATDDTRVLEEPKPPRIETEPSTTKPSRFAKFKNKNL